MHIDSGIDTSPGYRYESKCVDFVNNQEEPYDDQGHEQALATVSMDG